MAMGITLECFIPTPKRGRGSKRVGCPYRGTTEQITVGWEGLTSIFSKIIILCKKFCGWQDRHIHANSARLQHYQLYNLFCSTAGMVYSYFYVMPLCGDVPLNY